MDRERDRDRENERDEREREERERREREREVRETYNGWMENIEHWPLPKNVGERFNPLQQKAPKTYPQSSIATNTTCCKINIEIIV